MNTKLITRLPAAFTVAMLIGIGALLDGAGPAAIRRPQGAASAGRRGSGYQNVLVAVTIPAGGREGRHTHPGTAIVHVLEGALTLDHDGRPSTTYKAGETLSVEAGKVHEGINKGNTPVRAIASFVVEKGKPLTTQAK